MTKSLTELSDEQKAIVTDSARVRVVRASPGSGKTHLFVEEISRRLDSWTSRTAGVAALSFTNVAQQLIADRLGGRPMIPHFVGTIDAFVWRFVVRPFAHLLGVKPRLIPAGAAQALEAPAVKIGPNHGDEISLFRVVIRGGTEQEPELFQEGRFGRTTRLSDDLRKPLMIAKGVEWRSSGRLTHADSNYLGSCLARGKFAKEILDLLVARFPLILVDEFQDTGWFLGRSILAILADARTSGMVVGDPDQAIFGFGGARADALFGAAEALTGAKPLPLRETRRCGRKVSALASALSRTSRVVHPRADAADGRTIMLVHDQRDPAISGPLRETVEELTKGSAVGVLARQNTLLRRLSGAVIAGSCPLEAHAAQRLHQAVQKLAAGEIQTATRIVARDLGSLLLKIETPTPRDLEKAEVDEREWRRAVHRILLEAATFAPGETWRVWLGRVKARVAAEADVLGIPVEPRSLGATFKASGNADRAREQPPPSTATPPEGWEFSTIHSAKGREFESVVMFWPKPAGLVRCPSDDWWSAEDGCEEREVAFVGVSRAKSLLVLAVHRDTLTAMEEKRPDFLQLFERVELPVPATQMKTARRRRARGS